jgi:hypothetical protein
VARRIVQRAAPEQSVSDIRTLSEIVREDIAPRAAQVRIIGRLAELAVRIALGA